MPESSLFAMESSSEVGGGGTAGARREQLVVKYPSGRVLTALQITAKTNSKTGYLQDKGVDMRGAAKNLWVCPVLRDLFGYFFFQQNCKRALFYGFYHFCDIC